MKKMLKLTKKERSILYSFVLLVFLVLVLNVLYFYELYKLGGVRTQSMVLIDVFNVLVSFGIYVVIVRVVRNDAVGEPTFLRELHGFVKNNKSWNSGPKSLKFVDKMRLYSGLDELKIDVDKLEYVYYKRRLWVIVSVILLLPVLLCNSVEVLFCGENARIMMIWTKDVGFYLFFIPKCLFSLLLVVSLFLFLFYKGKMKAIINDPTRTNFTMDDVKNLL
jgi:hypothetical protein